MSGIESKGEAVELRGMVDNDTQTKFGIALLVLAGALLFASAAVVASNASFIGGVAVLGLAAGAYLVGTADEGRPV